MISPPPLHPLRKDPRALTWALTGLGYWRVRRGGDYSGRQKPCSTSSCWKPFQSKSRHQHQRLGTLAGALHTLLSPQGPKLPAACHRDTYLFVAAEARSVTVYSCFSPRHLPITYNVQDLLPGKLASHIQSRVDLILLDIDLASRFRPY